MRFPRLCALPLVLTFGCIGSKLDPDAGVTMTGALQAPSGSASVGTRTILVKVPDALELVTGGFALVGSLGTVCMATPPPSICGTVRTSTTAGDGTYAYQMKGADTQGSLGQASTFDLSAQLSPPALAQAGPSAEVTFQIQTTQLTVPTVQFWQPAIGLDAGSAQTGYTWDALQSPGLTDAGYDVHFTSATGQLAWEQQASPGGATDSRALEDFSGVFYVSGSAQQPGPDTTFQLSYASQRIAFHGAAGPAPSRGHDCYAQGPSGPVQLSPCTLTNGSFFDAVPSQPACAQDGGSCGSSNGYVYVDLGAPASVSAVFAHGLQASGSIALETSLDGSSWTSQATFAAETFHSELLGSPVTARMVRLRATSGTIGLAELSLW